MPSARLQPSFPPPAAPPPDRAGTAIGDGRWRAPLPSPRQRATAPRAHRVRRASLATVAAGAVAGLAGGTHRGAGVGTLVVLTATVAAVVAAAAVTGVARRTVFTGGILFLPWLVVRSSPWVLVPDLIAAASLVALGLSIRDGGTLLDSAHGYRRRAADLVRGAAIAPRRALLGIDAIDGQGRRDAVRGSIGPVLIGVAVAVAVAIVLASGDAVFASYLDVGDVVTSAFRRFVVALGSMSVVVAAAGAAAASRPRPSFPARRRSSARSIAFVAAPLVAVYVAYVAIQASALALGADYVTSRTGLTFAEYARSGFFQLVAVGVITFTGLTICRPALRRAEAGERRAVLVLASIAAGCTLAMVAAAVVKLQLYADAYGLTMLRLHTSVFAVWLGLAIAIAWWSLFRRAGEWVVPVVAATALLGVFAMNLVDPERVVAEHNLTATIDDPEFDVGYLIALGDPAVPSLVEHVDDLPAADRARVESALCAPDARRDDGLLDWNAARSAARAAAADLCAAE